MVAMCKTAPLEKSSAGEELLLVSTARRVIICYYTLCTRPFRSPALRPGSNYCVIFLKNLIILNYVFFIGLDTVLVSKHNIHCLLNAFLHFERWISSSIYGTRYHWIFERTHS